MPHPALDRARPRRVVAAGTAAVLSLAASVAGVATAGAAAGAVPPPVAAAAFDAARGPGTSETPRGPAPGPTTGPTPHHPAWPQASPPLPHVPPHRIDACNAGQVLTSHTREANGARHGHRPLCSVLNPPPLGGTVADRMFCTGDYDQTRGEIR